MWPTQTLGIHVLVLQVCKEYLAAIPNACQVLQVADKKYRKETHKQLLTIKAAEEQWILAQLDPTVFSPKLHAVVEAEGQQLLECYKHPVFTQTDEALVVTSWSIDPTFADEHICLLNNVAHFSICIIEISQLFNTAWQNKSKVKIELKKTMDVDMGKASMSQASMKKFVAKEVKQLSVHHSLIDSLFYVTNSKYGSGSKGQPIKEA
ncbi:hypothetical protein JAAARDRAFT_46555 [Jaapia argillacea MUCL 33604]|uniref:Uncharacterized protein n=1 Tax=Jaapia argillacea MUCL 33604 TaxID=933084 RepID=A0A067PVP7_9AGAM|nr:hypothetical protein JAAARDRAFT_46555 [Jaapia argillacea MUCL 33604]